MLTTIKNKKRASLSMRKIVKSSTPFDLGNNGYTRFPKHGISQNERVTVLNILVYIILYYYNTNNVIIVGLDRESSGSRCRTRIKESEKCPLLLVFKPPSPQTRSRTALHRLGMIRIVAL